MEYNFKDLQIELLYKKRKTIGLQVNMDGEIKVSVPIGISNENLELILEKKYKWLISKQKELIQRGTKRVIREYKSGEKYIYLGREYTLKVVNDSHLKKNQINIWDDNIIVYIKDNSKESIRNALEKWYRNRTLELAIERTEHYRQYFNDVPISIKAKEQKRRWASCTYDNKILFNWRCSMVPLEVFDYIVVHEMCHMEIKNHSKLFWKRVKGILPKYKLAENWLKENGISVEL